MATASRSQSTKRSEAPNKIKIQMNGSSAKVIHDDDSDDNSSDNSSPESPKVTSKESTKDDLAKKKKEAPIRVDTSVLENVTCTACGRQLNPYKNNSVQKHPELKVIICKKCDKFLSSGQIAKDKDGIDEQCRWCGEGGRLVMCDHCNCAFCKACVMRNFNRSEFNNINDQESWKCYICDKSQLQGLKDNYRNVRDAMKGLQAKKKNKEQAMLAKEAAKGNGRNPPGQASKVSPSQSQNRKGPQAGKSLGSGVVSSSSDSSKDGGGVALSVKDLEVNYTQVEVIMDKLSTATNTFKEMLRALRSQFHSTSPRRPDEAPPMFNFSLGNSVNIESKKQRCAKALNMGLQTYFQSLRKILHPQDYLVPNSSSQTSGGVSKSTNASASRNVSTREHSPISMEGDDDVPVLGDDSPEEDVPLSRASSRNSRRKLSYKASNKDKDTFSKTKAKNESESLKGKLSVSSLFPTPSKSSSSKQNESKSFKSCTDVKEKENKGDTVTSESLAEEESAHVSDTANDEDTSTQEKQNSDDDSEGGGSGGDEGGGDANDENSIDDETVPEKTGKDAVAVPEKTGKDAVAVPEKTGKDAVAVPEKAGKDAVDENVAAKLSMIQQLTEEISDSGGDEDEGDISEDVEDSAEDVEDNAKSAIKGKGTSKDKGGNSKRLTSPKGKAKSNTKEKDGGGTSSSSSKPSIRKTPNKTAGVGHEKQKSPEETKAESDNSDNADGSSSSDPLDSDDDDVDDKKTKKKKATEKDPEKATPKTGGSVKETNKPVVKETKNSKSNGKKSNGLPVQAKAKVDGKKKEKSKADPEDEDDEVDKEIKKLSRLPNVQKKKSKKDQKEEEAEKVDVKKGTRQSKRATKNKKEELILDDLSSDGGDENKSESEEEQEDDDIDSDMEPTVTFGPVDDQDVVAAEDNLAAKNQLLEEDEDDLEDEEEGEDSSDDDLPSEKAKSKKKPKKEKEDDEEEEENNDDEEDENADSDENIGRKKRLRNKLLDSKLTESDSDVGVSKKKKPKADGEESFHEDSSSGSSLDSDPDDKEESSDEDDDDEDGEEKGSKKKRKKKGKRRRRRKNKKDGSNDEEDEEDEGKGKKGKKRKRIKKMSDSSDEGDDDDDDEITRSGKRKKIRKVMSSKKLEDTTRAAAKAEEKRRKRIAAKQREFNVETVTDENNPMNAPMTTKLVLEPGKEEGDEPVIQVNKKLIKKLKPHQVEAVQFMWDCLYESVKRSKKEEGAGCILAHCMGLGKTLSVISFVHTVMTHCKSLNQRTCLVVCPLNTVFNWRNEWKMWFDKKDQLEVWELASCKQNVARAELLREWQESGGIMIIGYEMYRNLTIGARIKNKKQKKAFQETLVDPGPDLCVCDEGHILKNENSSLSKSMNMMKTRRRIVLTGTPLQNNLNEYHCMLSFVKPNLLGTRKEFNNRFISPIQNGQCTDSTQRDVRIMKARAHILHEMLAGCVQRRDYSALTKFLPPKQEYVMSIRLSEVQVELYNKYLELTGQGVDGVFSNKGARLFKDYQNLMKIWTHPWVLKLAEIRDELKMKFDDEEDSFVDDDSDEERLDSTSSSDSEENIISDSGDDEAPGSNKKNGTKRTRAKARRQAGEDSDPEEVIAEWKSKMRGENKDPDIKLEPADTRVSSQWWAQFVTEEDKNKVELSNKLYLLFEILRMSEEIGDKVLIFSQSILSLNIIESFLETVDNKFQTDMEKKMEEDPEAESEEFGKSWTKNLDYYRMDGSTSAHHRQMWAESFNNMDNYRARLFLISTKAGGLGINLVAANRVIIFDASWNPSHDVQSIFRVYRFGQIKPCYIYRFLAQGTMEEKIYERQVTKLSLSQRVVDEHQIERHFSANDLRELYNFKPEKWEDDGEHATLALPKDPLLAEILKTHRKCLVSFHEHDSLLENQVEQTLSEEEKKAAWEEYENEKKGIIVRGPGMESGKGASWPMMAAAQILSKEQIAATVHALRQQLPDLPEDIFHMHVQQALRRQVQMKQDEMRRMEMMRMQELTYLNMMQQQEMGGGMSGMGAMQNMAPWMQIQQLRAMQNQMMRGNRNFMMGGMSSGQISNRPDEAIDLDESPSKS